MKELLGSEFDSYLEYYGSPKVFRGLRVNTLKCSSEKLLPLLPFELRKTPFCAQGYYLPQDASGVGNHPLHHAGAFYVQEPSATSAVAMLGVKKGDRVLDLCAAPGGKSTQIAAMLDGEGLLWSNEIVRSRALILLSNIERMGVKNAVVSNCRPELLCDRLEGYFDKVLVDAPCSGEGMFRKNTAAEHWSVEHVKSCAERQLAILNSAKKALREGGELVYSTCTFSREENEGVITAFLKGNPDFELVDSGAAFGRPTLEYARRIFPMDGGEGHFAAKLRKNSEQSSVPDQKSAEQKIPAEAQSFYDEVFNDSLFGKKLEIFSDKVIAFENVIPDTKGLSILRKGILLGEIKKNRVEPCHAAFMAAKPSECSNALDLSLGDERITAFLRGEEIACPDNLKGYTAVCVEGIVTGFGKASNGRLKNKYPKGLRLL